MIQWVRRTRANREHCPALVPEPPSAPIGSRLAARAADLTNRPRLSAQVLRVGFVLLVVGAAGCSGGDDSIDAGPAAAPTVPEQPAPAPRSTPTRTPTTAPAATPTVAPTPTPTPTATPLPAAIACIDGSAGGFPCSNVGLEAVLTVADLSPEEPFRISDIWGWTDPVTGAEIVIVPMTRETVFVDVTAPSQPVILARLPIPATVTDSFPLRDVKVYADHAYIVAESANHGMQVLDLTVLRDIVDPPAVLEQTALYTGFSNAHNLVINEDSGFAYAVRSDTCEGGLHMIDLSDPASPESAGCFSEQGPVHDAQCLNYSGPAVEFVGRELCFSANEAMLAVTDVSDKASPVAVSSLVYEGVGYSHQGWLTPDQAYFLVNDELDEQAFDHPTRTRVFDVSDPAAPELVGGYDGPTAAVDHNLYIVGDLAYLANYRAGLRILRLDDPGTASLSEAGYFDTVPADDVAQFAGAFTAYPFFESGIVVVSSMEEGLFVLRPE